MKLTAHPVSLMALAFPIFFAAISCNKTDTAAVNNKPRADFSFLIKNQGALPDTVNFSSNSTNATSYMWNFDDGNTSDIANPQNVYSVAKKYNVKLIATNQYGSDTITKQVSIVLDKPVPNFTYIVRNPGYLPDTVDFVSTSTNAVSLKWTFGDGKTDTANNPRKIFTTHGTFNIKLVATNAAGSDSIITPVYITLNKPVASFNFTTSDLKILPVTLTTDNTTMGSNVTYSWSFGNGISTQTSPTNNFTTGGIYNIKLVATNASGSDSITKQIRISPFPQVYGSISGTQLNLFAWEGDWPGNKVMILSRNSNLNRATMFKWLRVMDTTYNYYKACTGRDPVQYTPTYIYNHTTIADVPSTCGAGCSYVGYTGIELQNTYFDINYNVINNNNQFDHLCFYEFGRNFWFYGSKLDYKEPGSFPIAGAFAVFMGSMEGRDAVGVAGSTVNGETYSQAKVRFENFLSLYLADPALTWANTLAIDKGVPGYCNAADLFTSMCMRLKKDYSGENFIRNIWKNAALRPDARTTQDAVDNFFLASCATANKNLTALFQSWRWPLSAAAVTAASQYP